jgi:hypothetical protein
MARRIIPTVLFCGMNAIAADSFSGWRTVENAPGLEFRWAPEGGLYHSCNLEFRDLVKMRETKAHVSVQYTLNGQIGTKPVSLWMYDKPRDTGRVERCDAVDSVTATSIERK